MATNARGSTCGCGCPRASNFDRRIITTIIIIYAPIIPRTFSCVCLLRKRNIFNNYYCGNNNGGGGQEVSVYDRFGKRDLPYVDG